jgi:hypothetical protein
MPGALAVLSKLRSALSTLPRSGMHVYNFIKLVTSLSLHGQGSESIISGPGGQQNFTGLNDRPAVEHSGHSRELC